MLTKQKFSVHLKSKQMLFVSVLSVFILFLSSGYASASVNVSGCQQDLDVANETYILTGNIGSGGVCLGVTASGITLVGAGYTITGYISVTSGIATFAVDDITITEYIDASNTGSDGGNGTSITVTDSDVGIIYAQGDTGATGATGADGANCECEDGDGSDGDPGGTGDTGGAGGTITIYGASTITTINNSGGAGGTGGVGGQGGNGGSNSGSNGAQGAQGAQGNGGNGGNVYKSIGTTVTTITSSGGTGTSNGTAGSTYTNIPSISITALSDGAVIYDTVSFSASASQFVGTALQGVKFYIDSTLIGSEDTSSPYTISLDTTDYAEGSHTLYAAARNASNAYATSSITVNIDQSEWTAQTDAGVRAWYGITSSSDGTKLAAVVSSGQIYTSTDSGATWTARDSSRVWRAITSSSDGTKLAAAVNNSYIYTSTDSGATWTTQSNSSGARQWTGIASSADGTKLAAVVSGGYIYTSTDSGATWSTQSNSSGSRAWRGITSSADGTKLAAVVSGGQIYTSTDSGANWTARDSSRGWRAITSSSDGAKLAATVSSGQIYTSTDSGATWTARDTALGWGGITSSEDGTRLAAVYATGYVKTSSDSGVTWVKRDNSGSRGWFEITSSSDGYKVAAAVGTAGYIYTSNLDFDEPTVSLTAPTDSETISGSSVALAATASDNVEVAGVKFYIDGALIGSEDTSSAYTGTLDSALYTDGSYSIVAAARDTNGNYATSTAVTVTVSNTVESVTTPSGYRSSIFSSFFNPPSVQIGEPGCQPGNLFSTLTGGKCISPSTPTESSKSGLPPGFQFTQVLRIGDFSEEVRNLQKFLNAQGFTIATSGNGSKGNEIRSFGLATKAALIKFQIANNIKPSLGFFGPITRGVVNGMVGK